MELLALVVGLLKPVCPTINTKNLDPNVQHATLRYAWKKKMKFFLVLPVACSGGRFEIKCIFENFGIARVNRGQFQYFEKSRGSFIPKIARPKHLVLVNHSKPISTLYWNQHLFNSGQFNYKSAMGQLQNNSVNGAMLITINCVITVEILHGRKWCCML